MDRNASLGQEAGGRKLKWPKETGGGASSCTETDVDVETSREIFGTASWITNFIVCTERGHPWKRIEDSCTL